jgi:hypothetical protein
MLPLTPDVIGNASGHRWCDLQRLVNPPEVIKHVMQADRMHVVFDLLGAYSGRS